MGKGWKNSALELLLVLERDRKKKIGTAKTKVLYVPNKLDQLKLLALKLS